LSCCWWWCINCCWWMEAARSRRGLEWPKFGLKMLSMEKGKNCLWSCWIGLLTAWSQFWNTFFCCHWRWGRIS
jgi:hypothetical protein